MKQRWMARLSYCSTRIEPGPRAFSLNLKLERDGRPVQCVLSDVEVQQLRGACDRYLAGPAPAERRPSDFLSQALNEGDGVYRP